VFDYFSKEEQRKRKEKSERLIKEFQENDLEKGDVTAMIIAAIITLLPAVLLVVLIFSGFMLWFFN